jgi:acetylornithine deacetylase/succinyl-diaminopimelate desuccinylase-like protein
LFGEPGYSPLERRGARPTLDVCGLWGGFMGEGSKTIIPAHAHAKVSCRLVTGMDPVRTFERVRDAILAVDLPGVEVSVRLIDRMDPASVDVEHPAVAAAARCLEEVFGREPYLIAEGGSIGAAASFMHVLGTPVVLLGFANPDDQAHAPNESLVLANYEGGTRTIVRYWEALGAGSDAGR